MDSTRLETFSRCVSLKIKHSDQANVAIIVPVIFAFQEFGVWTVSHVVLRSETVDSLLAFVHMISHGLSYRSAMKEMNRVHGVFCLFSQSPR